MAFDSFTFLLFFTVVWGVDRLPLGWTLRKANLLVASYLFYAAWSPPFVALLAVSTLVDWTAARGMERSATAPGRRLFLGLSLATNLGLLGFFKYAGFLSRALADALQALGFAYEPSALDVVLPVGISFYTFQTLSYSIDVYRGRLRSWRSPLDFALFVSFFPQLVAGPIVRAHDFLPQCVRERRPTPSQLGWGLSLLTMGLFAKVLLADGLMAPVVDLVYTDVSRASWIDGWIGTIAFANQIFFDFWGYSTCAIGIALTLGFSLPDNFLSPYAARGFSDFWRRWHVSLSTWLRDYLYICLGGNRRGRFRTALNVMLTMLLGGLWHGAAWRFAVWGGVHGLLLLAERAVRALVPKGVRERTGWATAGLTFLLVCLTWVPFRAGTLGDAGLLLGTMLASGVTAPIALEIGGVRTSLVALVTAATLAVQWRLRNSSLEEAAAAIPWRVRAAVLTVMIVGIATAPGDERAFLYFQF